MKAKRNLSGIYIRSHNALEDKYESRCFEDLEEIYQKDWLNQLSKEGLIRTCLILADTLNEISNKFNIGKS